MATKQPGTGTAGLAVLLALSLSACAATAGSYRPGEIAHRADAAPVVAAGVVDTRSCEAKQLAPAVSAYGAPEHWRAGDALPDALKDQVGERLNDTGHVADGYVHELIVDRDTGLGYVVQTGGFAGTRKVFGPFVIRGCAAGGQAQP
ncbi:MAG: hypothetical protein J7507_05170 [Pseudoxanthomonas sp.]|nr:hypothetical protein [Pseudoxanthomonas sp.]